MADYRITSSGRQVRTEGLSTRRLADIFVNDVPPEFQPVAHELLERIATRQLEGWSIDDGDSLLEGYWDPILRKREEGLYEVVEWTPDRTIQTQGINTTASYLRLQMEICQRFEAAFAPPN